MKTHVYIVHQGAVADLKDCSEYRILEVYFDEGLAVDHKTKLLKEQWGHPPLACPYIRVTNHAVRSKHSTRVRRFLKLLDLKLFEERR